MGGQWWRPWSDAIWITGVRGELSRPAGLALARRAIAYFRIEDRR
jgi:hypothetical protein